MTSPFSELFRGASPQPPKATRPFAGVFPDDREAQAARLEALSRNPIAPPEDMAEAARLGRSVQMPTDVVARNLATIRPMAVKQGPDWRKYITEAPKTARWLENPVNHSLAVYDAELLGSLERIAQSKFSRPVDVAPVASPKDLGLLSAEWRRGQLQVERGALGDLPVAQRQRPEVQARLRTIDEELSQVLPEAQGFERFVRGTTRILPGMVAGLKESAATAGVGGVVGGIIGAMTGPAAPIAIPAFTATGASLGAVYGSLRETARQIGGNLTLDLEAKGVEPEAATIAGLTAGYLGGAVEVANIGLVAKPFLKMLPAGAEAEIAKLVASGTKRALTRPTARAALANAGKYYATVLGTETAEEVLQQGISLGVEGVTGQVTGAPGIEVTGERVVNELIETGVETLVSMALIPVPGTALVGVEGMARVQAATSRRDAMAQAVERAKESQTRQRDPEAFREVVREQTDGQSVYLDAERATLLLQETGVTPEEFVKLAGLTMQDWTQAVEETGTELAIPVDALLANMAELPIAEKMLPDLRFEVGGMTAREAEAMQRDMAAFRERVAQEAEAVGDIDETDPAWRIVDDIRQELEETGAMTPEQAAIQAQTAAKPYVTWARAIASQNPNSPLADPWNIYTRGKGLTVLAGERAEALFDAEMAVARAQRLGRTQEEIDALRERVVKLADDRIAIRAVLEEAEQILDVRDEAGLLRKNLRYVSTDALVQEYIRLRDLAQQATQEIDQIQMAIDTASQGNVATAEEMVGVLEEARVAERVQGMQDAETWAGKMAAYDRYVRGLRNQARKVERSVPRLGAELEARGVANPDLYAMQQGLTEAAQTPMGEVPFQVRTPAQQMDGVEMLLQAAFHGKPYAFEEVGREPVPSDGAAPSPVSRNVTDATAIFGEGRFSVVTALEETGRRKFFGAKATTPQAVASGMSALARGADERFDVLLTDASGKPVAIVAGSKGGVDFATVATNSIIYDVARVPNAAFAWFVHNHPSGNPVLSPEDRQVSEQLTNALQGSGITPMGIMAVGLQVDGSVTYQYQAVNKAAQNGTATPAKKVSSVPFVERQIEERRPVLAEPVLSSQDVINIANQLAPNRSGILMLNSKNETVGFVEVSEEEALKFRETPAMQRIQQAAGLVNAARFAVIARDWGIRAERNAQRFLNAFGGGQQMVLDVVDPGQGTSRASRGGLLPFRENLFLQAQAEARPNAYYLRTERVIGLMKGANLSSFLHEMSHEYLATLQLVATNPDAPAWLVQDFETAMKHIGVKDQDRVAFVQYLRTGRGRTNAETKAFVAAEERWARSFESYLEKGEAPSRDLQRAFANFRVWLGQVYRRAKAMLIPVSPELRGVFDRMLATDEEITDYRNSVEARPLFTEQPESMTDAQWAEYVKGFQTRDAVIDGELVKRVMVERRAAVDADWANRREIAEQAIRDDLATDPTVQAVVFMRDGFDGQPMKLNRALLNAIAPDLWKSLPKGTTAADGTMTADAVALRFGFPDEASLIAALQRYEEVDAVVARRLAETFRREYGDLLGDSTAMADAVSAATHRGEADEPLLRELKALGRQLGIRVVDKPVLVQIARDMLGRMRVADIQPYKYELAEAKEARLAEQALRDGKPDRAAFHKRRQLLNRVLVRESRQAVAQAEKVRQFAVRMSNDAAQATLGKSGAAFADAMNAILTDYEFARVPRKQISRREAIDAYVTDVTEKGGVPMLSQEVIADARRINYRSLTLGELAGIDDAMRQIWHHAKTIDTIAKEGRRVSLALAEEAVVKSLETHRPQVEMDVDGYPLSLSGSKKLAQAVDAWHVPPTFLFRWLDGDAYGETWNTFFSPIKAAEDAELVMLRAASERAKQIDKMVDLPPVLLDRPVQYDGIRTPMTRRRLYALASNWGNESSRLAVLEARTADGYPQFGSAANIERMFAEALTAKDWEYIQARWDFINEYWPEIAEMERRTSGITPEKIEAAPFMIATADGKTVSIRGGYYPLAYDRNLGRGTGVERGQVDIGETALGSIQLTAGARAQTRHGWTNERVGSAGKPIDLSMGVWNQHIMSVIHDLTHREAVRDVYALLTRPGVREAFVRSAGLPYYDAVKAWLIRVANPNAMIGDVSYLEKLSAAARVGTTTVNLGLKFSTGIAQTLGYLQSVEAIGPKWMAIGMRETMSQRSEAVEFVMESSPMMANRRFSFNRDLADYARSRFGKMTNLDAFSFWFIGMMDGMVAVPTWIGAYRKAMASNGNDHDAAVRVADDTVESTQGAGAAKDLARVQGGPEFRKLLTMHYTAFSRMYGQFRRATTNVQLGKYGLPRFAAAMTLLWFGQVVLSELMAAGRGDEDEETMEQWLWSLASFPASLIVGLRDVIRAVGPEPWDYKLTPAEAAFEASIKAVNAVYRETLGDLFNGADRELTEAEAKALIEAPGYWFRLPTKAIWQYGDYLMDWMQGEVAPANPMEAAKGMLLNRR